jgi:hypothetical protein
MEIYRRLCRRPKALPRIVKQALGRSKLTIELEILKMSWYEHQKKMDELHRLYAPEHPKVLEVKNSLEEIQTKIDLTKKKIEKNNTKHT